MENSNFSYLEDEFPLLFNIAQAAELNLHDDPVTCLFKLRQFGEKLSEVLFEEHRLEFPYDNTFHNRLKTLEFEGVLPANIKDLFHAIRSKGNKAVHDSDGSVDDAKGTLLSSFKIAKWFYETYTEGMRDVSGLQCRETKGFTSVKLQKLVHLSEYMMEAELEHNYYYQTAGPYDNKLMKTIYDKMKEKKWFESTWQGWKPLGKQSEVAGYFDNYFGLDNPAFTRIMKKLGNASEQQCELISTLYAVWNDRLIKGESISQELLIRDFYAWSERKHSFLEEQVRNALLWMKENGFEPKGFGELIKRKKSKTSSGQ